jgi:hypothetical protein
VGMTNEAVRRGREVWRSKDVLVVKEGIDELGLARWKWVCKVRDKEAKERREIEAEERREREEKGRERVKRERELGGEGYSEGMRDMWDGKGKGKGRKEYDDSFKQRWRDLMARMEEEDKGEEAVGS